MRKDRSENANRIFKVIRDFENLFSEELEKCNINKCGHCGGSGLKDKHQLTYCTYCGGVGYVGFERIAGKFVCRACNGSGCKRCKYKGMVDWITHANGSDIMRGEKYL